MLTLIDSRGNYVPLQEPPPPQDFGDQGSISYAGPPTDPPSVIGDSVIVDVNGHVWTYWGGVWNG